MHMRKCWIYTSLEIIQNANRSLRRSAFWVHFLCVTFSSLVFFSVSFFHLLYYFTVAGQKYPIPFGCFLQKKKMKKTKFSTQKYPAVNFVLRKTLDATKMKSAYIQTSIHISSDENEMKKPYRKIIIKDEINRYSLIKNDCRPTIFGGFFSSLSHVQFFLVFVISRFVVFRWNCLPLCF